MQLVSLQAASGGPIYLMDCGFNYTTYVPLKRTQTKQTTKGSFTQRSVPLFLHGTGTFEWSIEIVTRPVAALMYDLYMANDLYIFDGAFGENYLVDFVEMKPPEVKSGYWGLSGTFRVVCVNIEIYTDFECIEE